MGAMHAVLIQSIFVCDCSMCLNSERGCEQLERTTALKEMNEDSARMAGWTHMGRLWYAPGHAPEDQPQC